MGSYFHVIERKVGGNLDAFRRELGRLRESGHFHRDRHERIMRIAQTVGFGHIVRQCLVDTGHRAGCEVHVLTSTGIVLVFNAHSRKLVTVLVARPGQVARYYEPFGEVEREFTCGDDAALTFSIMDSNYVRNGVTVTVLDAESGQSVYSETMVSNGSSETGFLPRAGRYCLRISNTDPIEHYLDAYVDSKSPVEIAGATSNTYVTTREDEGKQVFCKVSDASGRYTGTLTSNKILPTRENPKEASNE